MKKLSLLFSLVASLSFAETILPFELPWMNAAANNATYKSADHADSLFVLETYFQGCPYCHENADNVNKLADKYKGNTRVQVLDIGIDRRDALYKDWISEEKPNHPVLKDALRKVIRPLRTTAYPSTYILDAKGKVVFKSTGVWTDAKIATIESTIDKLLKP